MGVKLSYRDSPTVLLVRAAAKSIKRLLGKFDRDIKDLAQECKKTAMTEVRCALRSLVIEQWKTFDVLELNTPNFMCFVWWNSLTAELINRWHLLKS